MSRKRSHSNRVQGKNKRIRRTLYDTPPLDQGLEAELYHNIEDGVMQIYSGYPMSKETYMRLYTDVHIYSTTVYQETRRGSEILVERLQNIIQKHLEYVLIVLNCHKGNLAHFIEEWEAYKFSSEVINGIFRYVNKEIFLHCVAILKQSLLTKKDKRRKKKTGTEYNYKDVNAFAFAQWKLYIYKNMDNNDLTNSVLRIINNDANGMAGDMRLASRVINYFIELEEGRQMISSDGRGSPDSLDLYRTSFEQAFLDDAIVKYQKLNVNFEEKSVVDCMKIIDRFVTKEKQKAEVYLHCSTGQKVVSLWNDHILSRYLPIFHTEFGSLYEAHKTNDLATLYRLERDISLYANDSVDQLETYIRSQGLDLIKNSGSTALTNPKIYINAILDLHSEYTALIAEAFNSDSKYVSGLDQAFQWFINDSATTEIGCGPSKTSESLAMFSNKILKSSCTKMTNEEFERNANRIILILKYLNDKDIFQEFYIKFFALRIASQSSISVDAEEYMVALLRQCCWNDYGKKLEKILQDIAVSNDLNEEFRYYAIDNDPIQMTFHVNVLSFGTWPFQNIIGTTSFPVELEKTASRFNSFYNDKYSGRKLTWLNSMNEIELSSHCFVNKYIFHVSMNEMEILMVFNNTLMSSVEELKQCTSIAPEHIIQVVQNLLKSRIITCDEVPKCVNFNSVIKLNMLYNNKRRNVKINVPLNVNSKDDRENIERHILQNRKFIIQAAIVRIMKSRKTLLHQKLIFEVQSQLKDKFVPCASDIKFAIEMLIQKEYLSRSTTVSEMYEYVA